MAWIVVVTVGVAGIGAVAGSPCTDDFQQVEDIDYAVARVTRCTVACGAWRTGLTPPIKNPEKIQHVGGAIVIDVGGAVREIVLAVIGWGDTLDKDAAATSTAPAIGAEPDDVGCITCHLELEDGGVVAAPGSIVIAVKHLAAIVAGWCVVQGDPGIEWCFVAG